jgi:hypothetical protein
VTVDLGAWVGRVVDLRWRFASDVRVGTDEGWYVDDILLSAPGFDCTALALPGEVSEPGVSGPLRLARDEAGYQLEWSAPVTGGPVEEYLLYSRPILTSGRVSLRCEGSLGSGTSAVRSELPDGRAFLVVARNPVGEGPYGTTGSGLPRPAPSEICP